MNGSHLNLSDPRVDECFRTSEESVAMRDHAAVGFERGDVKKG